MSINEIIEQDPALSALPAAVIESIVTDFAFLNPLEFCKRLNALPRLAVESQRKLILAKINQPPPANEKSIQDAIENALGQFWSRLAER